MPRNVTATLRQTAMSTPDLLLRSKKHHARSLIQRQRLAQARILYREICQLDCRDAEAWFTLGLLSGMLGDFQEAAACNRQATELQPDYADAHFNHAKAQQALAHAEEAARSYRCALQLRPRWPEACNNLGNVLQEQGQLREAIDLYHQALAINPGYLDARINLGNALRQRGEFEQAAEQYRAVLAVQENQAATHKYLGNVQIAQGQLEAALSSYRRAAQLDPADSGSVAAQAAVLERQGRPAEAFDLIRPYLESDRVDLEIASVLAAFCDNVGRCDEAIALLERGLSAPDEVLSRDRRSIAHFSLGRLYDQAKDYDKAFAHVKAGNELKPDDFDRKEFAGFIDDLIATFDADFMTRAPRARHGSTRPLFIVGMPRSGTSLVEQILASHPDVCGGGELEDIKQLAFGAGALIGSLQAYPQVTRGLTAESCDLLAARYLNRLALLSREARYVTDKMPQNFLALGLIALLFPNARVIHCRRDPMDTCLSCYFHDFTGYHPYVYRLENLGFYYRQYQRLMRHWRPILPLPILEVVYEDLVANPKAGTRRLLTFCELPWDDRCLRFYESSRVVHTSSYQQVRKPVYRSSLGRWRHYAAYLEPLQQALQGDEQQPGGGRPDQAPAHDST